MIPADVQLGEPEKTAMMRRLGIDTGICPRRLSAIACCAVCLVALPAAAQERSALEVAQAVEAAVTEAIAQAEHSVVAIARVRNDRVPSSFGAQLRPDPFLRPALPLSPAKPGDPDYVPSQYGTGVVIDRRGLILTAYHVLGDDPDLYEYYVTTPQRRIYAATPYAADPRSDLALLSIDAEGLQPIALGNAAQLRKGQLVIALGNPYAIARDGQVSASWGIVSNLQRKAPPSPGVADSSGKNTLHHFGTLIQTDAKLNLGTSGGALLDLHGRMVGLTVAWAAIAGYEHAAGYAYPVDETFRRVVDTLKAGHEVEYGLLGVTPSNLTSAERLDGLQGARIDRLLPGSPADRVGLRIGDIVVSVNGKKIYDADSLVLEVGRLPVGHRARLEVLRGTRRVQVEVPLTKYPVRGKKIVAVPSPKWRGMQVDYISGYIAPEGQSPLGSVAFDEGVVVTRVDQHTAAWDAGLRPGMVISHVNQIQVRNPDHFYTVASGAHGSVRLRIVGGLGAQPREAVVGGS